MKQKTTAKLALQASFSESYKRCSTVVSLRQVRYQVPSTLIMYMPFLANLALGGMFAFAFDGAMYGSHALKLQKVHQIYANYA
ncbi:MULTISPECIES: hypothetical protein [Paenibacillus]|uniref:Uncharacterized protein n=1 Tax=Paenibacillus violae TaxID=3077234 RepID=A0ABU3RJQ8_9BACL|nr:MULTISPECIES: hypothetical protein [Paenibacillus]MDU0204510.1 hypothetical protein [Paenibacillus sp. PFR10]MEC0269780.1 hypothetical protein [Paenibacillus anseongense]